MKMADGLVKVADRGISMLAMRVINEWTRRRARGALQSRRIRRPARYPGPSGDRIIRGGQLDPAWQSAVLTSIENAHHGKSSLEAF